MKIYTISGGFFDRYCTIVQDTGYIDDELDLLEDI